MKCNIPLYGVVPTGSRSKELGTARIPRYGAWQQSSHFGTPLRISLVRRGMDYITRLSSSHGSVPVTFAIRMNFRTSILRFPRLIGADEALRASKPSGDFLLAHTSLFAGVS